MTQQPLNPPAAEVWEDLVNDFLEISARLSVRQRRFLINHLRRCRIRGESILPCVSFSIDKKLIVIGKGSTRKECLCYDPERGVILSKQPEDPQGLCAVCGEQFHLAETAVGK